MRDFWEGYPTLKSIENLTRGFMLDFLGNYLSYMCDDDNEKLEKFFKGRGERGVM